MEHSSTSHLIYSNGRRVASVKDGTLRKTIVGSRHILRFPERSIAFSVDTLEQALKAGAERIEVFDRESRATYTCSMSEFMAGAFQVAFKRDDPQLAFPCVAWILEMPHASRALGPGEVRFKPASMPRQRNPKKLRAMIQMPFKGWR